MNPPPIQWLPVFHCAAKHKSFRKAADQLNVSPPAISQQIKALEEYLGITLFHRNGPRLELTDAGELYQHSTKRLMQMYYEGFNELDRRYNQRSLRLNAPLFIAQEILIPHYLGFKSLEPNAELRISTGTEYIDFEMNTADAAIRFGSGDWSGLESKLLQPVLAGPICSPKYHQMHLQGTTLENFISEQTLLTINDRADDWQPFLNEQQPKDIIVCDSYFSVIKYAEQGLGIGMGLFPAINHWVNDERLICINSNSVDIHSGYWLVYPKQRTRNPLIQSCYTWAKNLFEQLPSLNTR